MSKKKPVPNFTFLDEEERELEHLDRATAEAEGIPYQTLASMILQKYVRGALLDKDAVAEVVKALTA
ncbi:MAG: hypothetical protein ACLQMF_14480 [Rectinemataceae bacterium]